MSAREIPITVIRLLPVQMNEDLTRASATAHMLEMALIVIIDMLVRILIRQWNILSNLRNFSWKPLLSVLHVWNVNFSNSQTVSAF